MVVTEVVKSFAQAGSAIHKRTTKLAKDLPIVRNAGNVAVGTAVVTAVSANMGGRSIFLSGVGSAGAKVSVTTIDAAGAVVVKMTGPAHFVERDTQRHMVGTGAVSVYAGHAMSWPGVNTEGGWVTGPFMAGGSQGRHPFERGVDEVRPVAPKIYDKGVRVAAVKAGFG